MENSHLTTVSVTPTLERMNGRERLQQWLDRSRLSQRALARLLGFHFTHVSQILSGRRNPGLANAVLIEQKTGIPVEAWVATSVAHPAKAIGVSSGKRKVGKA